MIVDDFLSNGYTLEALIEMVEDAGAKVAGCGVVIEKNYMPGGNRLREKGYKIESLAKITSISDNYIEFDEHK